jgi:CRISPR-associated protein Csd1
MILERLRDFHERIRDELIPRHHKDQRILCFLEINDTGELTGITDSEGTEIIGPSSYRTSHILPHFPIDKAGYVLGIPKSESEGHRKRASKMHEAYVELVEEAVQEIDDPPLGAFLNFLKKNVEEARKKASQREVEYGDFVVPRLSGTALRPDRNPQIRAFWQNHMDEKLGDRTNFSSQCAVCGEVKPIADLHSKVSGIGAQPVGMVVGDKDAYRSHGLEKSEIAPTCFECADKYTQVLQYLLDEDRHHLRLADVTWVYWTDRETGFDPMTSIAKANPRDVETLLEAAYGASEPGEVESARFYAAALTSNISRLAVRSWVTATVEEVQRNVGQYFERMRLVGRDGPRYHGLSGLASSLVPWRDNRPDFDKLPPQTNETILSHALTGRRLPKSLMHRATRRARVEGSVTHPRAALLKLVLLSNQPDDADPMVDESLKPNHDNPAYHCGRLLAVLENIQREAVNPNTTLVDRYYGTASTAPASVFGNLMRSAQSHLSKLRRDSEKGGLGVYFQKQLGEIMTELDERGGFPNTLSAQDQALFALGYYQQRHRTGESSDDDAPDTPEPAEAAA